jgi:Protein of unknown function (DUF1517)
VDTCVHAVTLVATFTYSHFYSFDGAGYSLAGTQAVLNSIASKCRLDNAEVTRAVEVFWTPSDPSGTLTSRDIIADFSELIDL